MGLSIAENFRGIFYIPFYVLRERGEADRNGLQITWLAPGAPGGAIDDVKSGRIDLTWGGPMRVMIDHDTSADDERRLVSVSQTVGKDPFCLLTRKADMRLEDLPTQRLAVVKEVPTPWLCLQLDLFDRAISLPRVVRQDLDMAGQFQALEHGDVDVIQAFEPFVSRALRTGDTQLLYAASSRGPTVYTGFITSRQTLNKRLDAIKALDRAMGNTLGWMHSVSAAEVAACVQSYFPETELIDLEASISRYLEADVWSRTTHLERAGFDRLAESFLRGGALRARPSYEHCVFNFGDLDHVTEQHV